MRGVLAHGLVLLQRDLDPLGASGVATLAHELCRVRIEPVRSLLDPFVHVAEQGFGLGDSFSVFLHRKENV